MATQVLSGEHPAGTTAASGSEGSSSDKRRLSTVLGVGTPAPTSISTSVKYCFSCGAQMATGVANCPMCSEPVPEPSQVKVSGLKVVEPDVAVAPPVPEEPAGVVPQQTVHMSTAPMPQVMPPLPVVPVSGYKASDPDAERWCDRNVTMYYALGDMRKDQDPDSRVMRILACFGLPALLIVFLILRFFGR